MKNKLKNKELGKGIEALIRSHSTKDGNNQNLFIEIKKIIPNKNNPREDFNNQDMIELENSIYKHGILQPLTVRKIKNGKYELISGARRF